MRKTWLLGATLISLVLAVIGVIYWRRIISLAAELVNVAVNPSFEQDVLGWTFEKDSGMVSSLGISNVQPLVGSSVAQIDIQTPNSNPESSRLMQTINLEATVPYTFDFAVRSEKPMTGKAWLMSGTGSILYSWSYTSGPVWSRTSGAYKPIVNSDNSKLVIAQGSTLGKVWVDDVQILRPPASTGNGITPTLPIKNTPTSTIVPGATATNTPKPGTSNQPTGSVKNYYVDCVNGNDANTGDSVSNAWKSLTPVNNALGGSAQPGYGYLLKRGCSWSNNKLSISRSGTSANPIVVGWYGDVSLSRPVIQSSDSSLSQASVAQLVVFSGASYVTLDGLVVSRTVSGYSPSINSYVYNVDRTGVQIQDASHHILVKNSVIKGHAVGLRITCNWNTGGFYSTYSNCSHDNRITNNEILDNNVMIRNTSGGDDDSGAQGIDVIGSNNNEIDSNLMSGGTARSYDYGSDGSGVEIFGASGNVIHHNVVKNSDAFSELGDPTDRSGPTANNTIRNNYYCSNAGKSNFIVARGGGASYGPTTNTIVDSNSAYTSGSSSMIYCDGGCDSSILKLRNNILWSTRTGVTSIDGAYENTNNTFIGNTTSSNVFLDPANCNLQDSTTGRGAYESGGQIPGINLSLLSSLPRSAEPTTVAATSTSMPGMTHTMVPTSTSSNPTTLGAEVDTTDTDDVVNKFVLDQVASGRRNVAAGGAWWGLTTKANENQIWLVNRNVEIGKVYGANGAVTADVACVMPGVNGLGTSRNTLNKNPEMTLHMWPNNISGNSHQDRRRVTPNTFVTYQVQGESSGSQEKRTECHTEETVNDIASGRVPGEVVQANLNHSIWFGSRSGPWGENDSANHNGVTAIRDFMDSHGWYTDIEYIFNILENPFDLMGKTVKGTIALQTRVQKSKGTGSVHHRGIKIEQNYKDYWVDQTVSAPDLNPLTGVFGDKGFYEYRVDTTKLTDGWHIVSFHSHAIDKGSMPGHFGMQIATEMKIPVCVNNTNIGRCPVI